MEHMLQPKDIVWLIGNPYIYYLQDIHFGPMVTYRLKVRGWKKIFHANRNQKRAGEVTLI